MRDFSEKPGQLFKLLLFILAIAGILLLTAFLRTPSEPGNQFMFGFSKARLLVAAIFAFLLLLNIGGIFWASLKPAPWQIHFESGLIIWVRQHVVAIFIGLSLISLLTGTSLLITISPAIRMFAPIQSLTVQAGVFLLWVFLAAMLFATFIRQTFKEDFLTNRMVSNIDRFLLLASLFLFIFFAYEHVLLWTGAANQTRYSYWNYLADAFLDGKIHLENPPQTHDLTFHNGRWYQPMPPAPAILMMPLAYLVGGKNIDTNDFSIALSALNAVLIFLILQQLTTQKWTHLSTAGLLLLVILFAFGTPHLWVGLRGRAWFISQVVTVTFLALAVLGSLRSWSPWWVGACIGFAIAARPNSIMTWPFAFAIAMQILKEKSGSVNFRQMLRWAIPSVVPMGMAVAGLLSYNYARFGNFLDFGYVTISGDPTIVANAQTYGMFSPHYFLTNLKVMFFSLPAIQSGGRWPILPSTVGTSLFLVTPPLLYLFHRYERQWWILGAWTCVFLNFLLLVLYHNTGAHQFGYRYILDAIIPILALLAVAVQPKVRWPFILLLLFSIAFNLYGTYWFING